MNLAARCSHNTPKENTEHQDAYKHRGLAEEIERVKLMGAVRPPDDYDDWFPGAAAFKREYPDDEERAFACFDAWSACSLTEYKGSEDARCKFDQVAADYDGPELTVGMLYSRARRRALKVLNTLYPATSGRDRSIKVHGVQAPSSSKPGRRD